MLAKDYLGKNAEQEIWKLDAALVSQINATLKQAAIEEGQWNAKREIAGGVDIEVARIELPPGGAQNLRRQEGRAGCRTALAPSHGAYPVSPRFRSCRTLTAVAVPAHAAEFFLFVLFLDFRRRHGLRKGQRQGVGRPYMCHSGWDP